MEEKPIFASSSVLGVQASGGSSKCTSGPRHEKERLAKKVNVDRSEYEERMTFKWQEHKEQQAKENMPVEIEMVDVEELDSKSEIELNSAAS